MMGPQLVGHFALPWSHNGTVFIESRSRAICRQDANINTLFLLVAFCRVPTSCGMPQPVEQSQVELPLQVVGRRCPYCETWHPDVPFDALPGSFCCDPSPPLINMWMHDGQTFRKVK